MTEIDNLRYFPNGHDNGHDRAVDEPAGDLFEPADPATRLGMVVAGSLSEGLTVRLDPETPIEEMKVGRYVTIQGQRYRFFGIVSDVRLDTVDPRLAGAPPDLDDDLVADVVRATATYGALEVVPMLTIDPTAGSQGEPPTPQPVKTVPAHFSAVHEANDRDMELIFGKDDGDHFVVGSPLDMETKVCLNMKRLVERSTGIFGKSGTGKTFLTRLLLVGMVQKSGAVSLIFDMHNEYGWSGHSETAPGGRVKALKQLFPSKVAIFTLDPKSSRDRGARTDYDFQIAYSDIEPEDLVLLREALDMTQAQIESVFRLARKWGDHRWLQEFLDLEPSDLADLAAEQGLNPSTLEVLHRKMQTRLQRLPFLVRKAAAGTDSVREILNHLRQGIHVVLEFGRHNSLDAYMLVANVLTRRIHEQYVEEKERALGDKAKEPRPLVIVIEEAHKFLSPEIAGQTIFGTIAREMRKFNVTLLVVDQRPSGIDEEVMSQIGTRITCLLDNEKDVDAVLMGVSGRSHLRGIVAKLETRQQALIFGHAVPMPVVIKTAEFGSEESYRRYGFTAATAAEASPEDRERQRRELERELFGD